MQRILLHAVLLSGLCTGCLGNDRRVIAHNETEYPVTLEITIQNSNITGHVLDIQQFTSMHSRIDSKGILHLGHNKQELGNCTYRICPNGISTLYKGISSNPHTIDRTHINAYPEADTDIRIHPENRNVQRRGIITGMPLWEIEKETHPYTVYYYDPRYTDLNILFPDQFASEIVTRKMDPHVQQLTAQQKTALMDYVHHGDWILHSASCHISYRTAQAVLGLSALPSITQFDITRATTTAKRNFNKQQYEPYDIPAEKQSMFDNYEQLIEECTQILQQDIVHKQVA